MMRDLRVLVVGAGALGSVIATKLTRAGIDTVALDSNLAHVNVSRNPGARIDLPHGQSMTTPLQMVTSVQELVGPFDYALITLKAPAVAGVLTALVKRELVENYVSLGNGLIQDVIVGIVGADRLLVGTVSWGATFVAPGHVQQTTMAPFALGEFHPGVDPARLPRLIEVLSNVAPSHTTDNISGQVWAKLLLNSSLSGLGTVAGTNYAAVVESRRGRELVLRMWTEGLRVAEAIGERLDEVAGVNPYDLDIAGPGGFQTANRTLDSLMISLGATKASMLQDLERGLVTEVNVINGAVARVGKEHDVPTPFNQRCVEIIQEHERGETRPGLHHLARFDDLISNQAV